MAVERAHSRNPVDNPRFCPVLGSYPVPVDNLLEILLKSLYIGLAF